MNRRELPHNRFANAGEEKRHEIRERVAFYAPSLRPDEQMRNGHWDLEINRGAPHDRAVLPVHVLVELLDRLDGEVGS